MAEASTEDLKSALAQNAQKDKTIASQAEAIDRQTRTMDVLAKEVEELKRIMAGGSDNNLLSVNNRVNVTNNNNVTNNVTVVFNSFGKEDLGHLDRETTARLLMSGSQISDGIAAVGMAIWCDPSRPHNYTVDIPNVKGNRVTVRRPDGSWKELSKQEGYRQMHTRLTDHAYANQPLNERMARAEAPRLKELDAIEKGEKPMPVGVYDTIALRTRALR
jgi:hypothetical protein